MPKPISKEKQAARLLCQCPALNVPQAMRAAGFTDEEAKNRTLQMRVRRHHQEVTSVPSSVDTSSLLVPLNPVEMSPLTVSTEDPSTATAISNSTSSSITRTSSSSEQIPGTKRIRLTAKQSQQDKVNKKRENDIIKQAHKKATTLLAAERKKKLGKGARKIVISVNSEFKTSLTWRTVSRYVQSGLEGRSPLKRGSVGGLQEMAFKMLTVAVETYIQEAGARGT
jgi:hypothetical protein